MTITENLSKLLILLIISTGLPAHAEDIVKPYEITNVMVSIFFFDTEAEMQDYRFLHFAEELNIVEVERDILGFSGSEPYAESHNFCHLDMYVVRPTVVDDEETSTIGHEFLHCVYGPDYHRP